MNQPIAEPLLDINQIADTLRMPPASARVLLDMCNQSPAAVHRGKPLWLRDALDKVLEEAAP